MELEAKVGHMEMNMQVLLRVIAGFKKKTVGLWLQRAWNHSPKGPIRPLRDQGVQGPSAWRETDMLRGQKDPKEQRGGKSLE